jgi:Flp pilus assembly protein TadG
MSKKSFAVRLQERLREFRRNRSGNVAVIFVITLIPLVSGVGVAVDTSRAMSVRAAVQAGLDSTALNMMKQAASLSSSNLSSTATTMFLANFNRPEASNIQISATYNSGTNSLSLTGTADVATEFMTVVGLSKFTVRTASTAKMGGSQRYAVCVLVTDPTSGHTLLVKNLATINFTNCLVQVNTANWDAVEARDTSYIHSVNGQNCFVGDIHYGDVLPPKLATCTLLNDPFAGFTVPATACNFTSLKVTSATTLSPGRYCHGLQIQADTTFSPGVYTIDGGALQVSGNTTDITANGVTFLLTGSNAGVNINTSGNVQITAASDAVAGTFGGFVFYLDQSANAAGSSTIQAANMTASGIIYLRGQKLNITNGAAVVVNPGGIVADFILPDGASLNLTGTLSSSTAAGSAFQKSLPSQTPVLTN